MNASRSLLGLFLDREICRHQLGPDQPPIVRAQVTTCNSAVSGPLDCRAALDWNGPCSGFPLAQQCGWHIENSGKVVDRPVAG